MKKTKAKNPAKFTIRNVLAILQSLWRKKLGGITIPSHIHEQIIWRRTQVIKLSSECWESGNCIECGCEILGKTMEDRGCDGPCYPSMMNKKEWKEYKNNNDIKLFE